MRTKSCALGALIASALFLNASDVTASPLAPKKKSVSVEAEGFKLRYKSVATPEGSWGSGKEESWILGFEGGIECKKGLSYRNRTLDPGKYDVWVERGKGEWYYLYVGDRDNEEAPRLRAMFKIYEQEQGVDRLEFQLKLTRKGTKLKFSLLAGQSEGHGNFKIVE